MLLTKLDMEWNYHKIKNYQKIMITSVVTTAGQPICVLDVTNAMDVLIFHN